MPKALHTLFALLAFSAITFTRAVTMQAQTETVLHTFSAGEGYDPVAGLIMDAAGNFYGTTSVVSHKVLGIARAMWPVRRFSSESG